MTSIKCNCLETSLLIKKNLVLNLRFWISQNLMLPATERNGDSQPACFEDVESIETSKFNLAFQSNVNGTINNKRDVLYDAETLPRRSGRAKKLPSSR